MISSSLLSVKQVFWLWFFNAVYHSLIFFWFPVAMMYHGL